MTQPNPDLINEVAAKRKELDNLHRLRSAQLDLLREAGRQSTWIMATMVLWKSVANQHYYEPFHKPLCDWLDDIPKGGKRAVIVFREARKTMLQNIARCVRLITANPDIRIMAMTRYLDTAEKMCSLVKEQLQKNEGYREVYPETSINEAKFGKVDEFTHPNRTATGLLDPTYFATYLGAPLISRRCDVLMMDDAFDEDDFTNPDIAAKTLDKFTETLPLVDKTSHYNQRIFIGTPKSYNDPAAIISGLTEDIAKEAAVAGGGYEVIRRAALENANGEPDIDGEPALPIVHSRSSLMDVMEQCRLNPAKGESYFWREYMTVVQAPGDRKFLPEWFDNWVPSLPHGLVRTYLSTDTADKDQQVLFRGDYTVLLAGGFDQYGNLYIFDGARSNAWRSADRKRELISMCQRNNGISNVIAQKVGEGTAMGQLQEWFNEARMPLVLYPIKIAAMGRKSVRIIDGLQAPAMARKIFFVGDPEKGTGFPADLHKSLVDEAVHLGMWSHDDIIDALANFFHPDVRVIINNRPVKEWIPPNTRYIQPGTAHTNPATLRHISQREAKLRAQALAPSLQGNVDIATFSVGDVSVQPAAKAGPNAAWWRPKE